MQDVDIYFQYSVSTPLEDEFKRKSALQRRILTAVLSLYLLGKGIQLIVLQLEQASMDYLSLK